MLTAFLKMMLRQYTPLNITHFLPRSIRYFPPHHPFVSTDYITVLFIGAFECAYIFSTILTMIDYFRPDTPTSF